jgi:hypothetical protein
LIKYLLNSELVVYNGYEELTFRASLNHLGLNVSSFILTREFDIEHAKKKKNKRKQQTEKKQTNQTKFKNKLKTKLSLKNKRSKSKKK